MRSTGQRKSDAIEKLNKDQDVWVATADDRGIAHLVPLSLCWHDGMVVVAVEARSRTARNASASGQARLALGPSRDVVMTDAEASVVARPDAGPAIASAYRERTGWKPGSDGGDGSASSSGRPRSRSGETSTRSPAEPASLCEAPSGGFSG